MNFSQILLSIKTRFSIVKRLTVFLWKNKLWWLIPIIIMLIVFFVLMVFVQTSPLGPLIYPLI